MRIVLDTNVLISGIFWKGNESRVLKKCQARDVENYISMDIFEEFIRVLVQQKFGLTEEEIDVTVSMVASFSTFIESKKRFDIVKEDPGDNKFLECAYGANAEFLISGDKHLLTLKRFKGTEILSAREFLKEIQD